MKHKLLLLIIFFSSLSFAQSKTESKEWIVEKYNEFKRVNEYSNEFDLNFENEFLIIKTYKSLYKIQIKDIKKIQIKKERWDNDDKEGWSSVYFYYGKNDSVEITMSSEFIESGYKKRMENALLHLIKLYGGNATIKKEAF
ncbi:hypothetical protein [Flavobacterium sp.]|uniref:hypothetical protein n=1 Tax=Flavobacterium sp. TaxID=239 RepID=UPI0039E56443